jgi:hypothetical protein
MLNGVFKHSFLSGSGCSLLPRVAPDRIDQQSSIVATTLAPIPVVSNRIECLFSRKGIANIKNSCPHCLSQGNQDLILSDIFNAIGTTNQRCVEFGFGYSNESQQLAMADFFPKEMNATTNGTTRSNSLITSGLNTHSLIRKGWTPVFFDAEYNNSNINLVKAVLTETLGWNLREQTYLWMWTMFPSMWIPWMCGYFTVY